MAGMDRVWMWMGLLMVRLLRYGSRTATAAPGNGRDSRPERWLGFRLDGFSTRWHGPDANHHTADCTNSP